ncbi:MAG TPA: DUF308 domain-containing protein [Solirubrobacterales bacterium]|nr:DUF308 domain-containing protein [Solirubrobacterales bacterium]
MESSARGPLAEAAKQASRLWWLWLVFGAVWSVIAVVILQFDDASITTVGVLIGLMFFVAALQAAAGAVLAARHGWVYGVFAFLFVIAGFVTLISPEDTFAALADILGFLFLIVAVSWIFEAFMWREENEFWWVGLIGGVLMLVLAFWTAGQFFIDKEYLLLVFAGIWALMRGITDFVRAFAIREIGRQL